MPGRLKMEEIAALTGYSVSTVSRVLSGKSYTSDKAREAIVRTARELGRVRISTLRNENETFSQLNSITYIG
ncbi:LacI family DNA-binding transcriptional regulator, partial [Enterobacter kobei]|uniref:LacI family DNA-binding transcriptional regulator n=2 Tax=Enterobacter kobei TaxID=208224 RepID=UPI00207438CD